MCVAPRPPIEANSSDKGSPYGHPMLRAARLIVSRNLSASNP